MEMIHSVYPHDEVFGQYITINDYIDCPPHELFAYMADTRCLEEWTYSLRGFTKTDEPGLWLAYDRLGSDTRIYTRTRANERVHGGRLRWGDQAQRPSGCSITGWSNARRGF